MKRIILIGTVEAGKTTLANTLLDRKTEYKKTQSVDVLGNCIVDTPGEFLERSVMRGAIATSSAEAEVVVFVQPATDERTMFPPAYSGSFAKEVIGIITKTDIATEEQIKTAELKLKNAGAPKIFKISCFTGEGVAELKRYLQKGEEDEGSNK